MQFLSITGTWASVLELVVGIASLIFSILSMRAAQAAKRAAQSAEVAAKIAKRIADHNHAADELAGLAKTAENLHDLIVHDRNDRAAYIVQSLLFELNEFQAQWIDFLDVESQNFIEKIKINMGMAIHFLNPEKTPNEQQKNEILVKCLEATQNLLRESGKMKANDGGLK